MEIFYLTSHRKKIIWSNLFKSFKDTILKTNTCFRQHHESFRKTFQRKRFRNKWFKRHKKNHSTWQNSWSHVTIRELQARKHNQFSAIKTPLAKDKIQKRWIFSWYLNLDIRVFLKQRFVSRLLTFEEQKVMKFHEKLSRKRWQVINFSPLSSQNSSRSVLELKLFNRFYIWYFETKNLRFKIRTLKLAFSKSQTIIEHES